MNRQKHKVKMRDRRRVRIRRKVSGTPSCPRLSVYKSLNHVYAQVIDDLAGRTIVAASTRDPDVKLDKTGNAAAAAAVGAALARKAKAAGVEKVVFDRGGFRFHGRVKALAEAAREGGLKF
ncbi:MAG: 50S ribosomal protein L18 [Phycisphaeraceae bacterium]|nr:50S ribosomal protein L18 [Phycisphaeraceae bacterium]MCW5754340.1 50S ribosomal protein L18 [Phycisphaeraceae bacterium]